jgi:hypothetical protein
MKTEKASAFPSKWLCFFFLLRYFQRISLSLRHTLHSPPPPPFFLPSMSSLYPERTGSRLSDYGYTLPKEGQDSPPETPQHSAGSAGLPFLPGYTFTDPTVRPPIPVSTHLSTSCVHLRDVTTTHKERHTLILHRLNPLFFLSLHCSFMYTEKAFRSEVHNGCPWRVRIDW